MGMFNEVSKKCPKCEATTTVQIPQVVLGFGSFDLDDSETTNKLSVTDKLCLQSYLKGKQFHCFCGNSFFIKVLIDKGPEEVVVKI